MSQPLLTPVLSPCINVCRMNEASGFCEGCLRTLDEIGFWSVLDEDDKHAVCVQLEVRRSQSLQNGGPAR